MSKKKSRRESSDTGNEETSSESNSSSGDLSSEEEKASIKRSKKSKRSRKSNSTSSSSSPSSSSSEDCADEKKQQKRKKHHKKQTKKDKKDSRKKIEEPEEKNFNSRNAIRSIDRCKEGAEVQNRSKWDSPGEEGIDDQRNKRKGRDRRYEDDRNDRFRRYDDRNYRDRSPNDNRRREYSSNNRSDYRNRDRNDRVRDQDRERRSPDRRRPFHERANNRERLPFRDRRDDRDRRHMRSPRQTRNFRRTGPSDDRNYEWGQRNSPDTKPEIPAAEKEKPNFELSGKLTEDTNKVNGIIIKYAEPQEARKPKRRWRLYPFKGENALPTLYIHRQSCYLIGRDRKVCDLAVDHPSCSKQHAALQYRLVPFEREDGTVGKRVRPYLIDLESANGTFINNKQMDSRKYIELLEKDVIKFGFSSREYVLLHENSKEDQLDDDVINDEVAVKEEPTE